jgi:uncharacterized membrane protein
VTRRLVSVDLLRGLAIVVMALDHVRDYFTNVRFDPLDLSHTTGPLFLTRWITHFCAPIFILLAGVSARLVARRLPRRDLSRFLLTRGLWLVFFEVTVVTYAWLMNVRYELGAVLQVIWAIGVSMMALSVLVYLPIAAIGTIGIGMIAGHNLLDGISPERFGRFSTLWYVLHVQGQTPHALVLYPVIPWIGVMATGYVLGGVFEMDAARRRRVLAGTGALLVLAFLILRYLNGYGDPLPWKRQPLPLFTVLSFLNANKYPPSLLYLFATLGPALLALAWFEHLRGPLVNVFVTFGRVPFFFYVTHLYVVHLMAGLIGLARGFGLNILGNVFLFFPPGWGFRLGGVYAFWILIVALLYPACAWFARVKQERRDWWLSYV